MRIMLLEDDPVDILAMRRELDGHHQLTVVSTLRDALTKLAAGEVPDVIVSDLNLPDSRGVDTLAALKSAAPSVQIVVSTGQVTQHLRERIEGYGSPVVVDKSEGYSLLETALRQIDILHRTVAAHRSEIISEIESIADQAAEKAVAKAMDQLTRDLGMHDREGVRMAVRLARGWDAAKARFLQALATGIAGAMLVALGSGILAMLRNQGSK